jgi:hypothetical protein
VWSNRLSGDDDVHNDAVTPALASVRLEAALAIRRFYGWQGRRNYEGQWWWSSTAAGHVPFESLLERDALMAIDFSPDAVAVAAQPLALLWPRGTQGHKRHVPDFFVRYGNGDGHLIDVRHPDRVEDAQPQFDLTRAAAEEVGWKYDVFTGLPPSELQNLRWLSGYRHSRSAPTPEVLAQILGTFSSPTPLQLGAYRASRAAAVPRGLALAHVYHLLWVHRLHADLLQPLTKQTEVWS